MTRIILVLGLSSFLLSCGDAQQYNPDRNYKNEQKSILTKFIMAEDSSVIELDAGHFLFSKSLILEGKSHVTIKGKGIDKTVLSFKGQTDGAEGIRIANCANITLLDFSIEDAAGDNVKVTDTDGITFKNIKSAWTGTVDEMNGAYGLYPVLCKNVKVLNCEIMGASDAGIYVGQSKGVEIANNKVYWNVAGIESENSQDVVIYNNEAYENTGGILAFDLPGLTMYGSNVKIYNNKVYKNNMSNFAPAGNMVGIVPPGTGMLILATQGVEVSNNIIQDNKTIGIGLISYKIVEALGFGKNSGGGGSREELESRHQDDPNYNPYVGHVYVHDNEIKNNHSLPDLSNDFGKLFLLNYGTNRPDIAWDGIEPPEYKLSDGTVNPDYKICIQESEEVLAVNLDAGNDFENMESNPILFDCTGE